MARKTGKRTFGWFLRTTVFVAVCCAVVLSMEPPAPRAIDADSDQFSALRAMRWVERLAEAPRPPGSVAHDRARDTVVASLKELGGDVRVVKGTVARAYANHARAAAVENIVAEFAGEGPSIVLAAHYDSVPTGPGAGDDASGVAVILEALRTIRATQGRIPRMSVWITDAEEAGLLGARQLATSQTIKPPGIVINLEARGGGGPVFCFQTSGGNLELARRIAKVGRLSTSSLMVSLYRRLPNGTDFTVFRDAGFAGVDFAFIGDWSAYHTALDGPERLDVRSVQQEGDAVVALVRALAEDPDPELLRTDGADAGWFDVLGRWVIVYPLGWTWPAVATMGLLYVGALVLSRREKGATGGFFFGLASGIGGIAVAAGVAYALRRLLPDPAAALPWTEAWGMRGIEAGLFAWGMLVPAAFATFAIRRVRSRAVPLGAMFPWVAAGIAVAAMEPGAAWCFVIPTVGSLLALLPPRAAPALVIPAVVLWCVLVVPVVHGLALALGWPAREVLVGVAGFAATPLFVAFRGDDAPKSGGTWTLVLVMLLAGGYGAWHLASNLPDRPSVRTDFLWAGSDGKGVRIRRAMPEESEDGGGRGTRRPADTFVPWLAGDWVVEPTDAPTVPANVRIEGDTLVLESLGSVPEWLVWSTDRVSEVEWDGTRVPLIDGKLRLRLIGGDRTQHRLRFAGGDVPRLRVVGMRYDAGEKRPVGEEDIPAPMWPPPGGAAKEFDVRTRR